MADDEEMFVEAMRTLGIKPTARAARPKKKGEVEGSGVTVSEDVDFDALMREGRGPATEVRAPRGASKADAITPAPAPGPNTAGATRAPERARHAVSPEEAREFLAAMADLDTPPVSERERALEAARTRAPAESGLGRRLKRGNVEVDAILDLHGSNRKEARPKLDAFIKEAVQERWALVAIVVGRGLNSPRDPVLRPTVEAWLRDDYRAEVTEVHPAPPYLGGSGAWIAAVRVGKAR